MTTMKRIFLLISFALFTIPTQAGVFREIGHCGKEIGRSTTHMAKSVGKAIVKWIW
jgi:hypothetical protein